MENIKLKGCKNTRDLGGIAVDGGRIKPGCLLRGGHLNLLSDEDSAILFDDYNLRSVIDVRTQAEKEEKPDVRMSGVDYIEMPIFDSSIPGLSHESKSDLDSVPDMRELYAAVMQGECLENLCAVVRKIVTYEKEGSILYHCTEGKDRTGMITALILMILGAKREDIVKDYLFTNTVNERKAKKYRFLVKYIKRNKPASEKVYNVFIAKEEYLNEVFKAVDTKGLKAFISEDLKLTEADISAFRKRVAG